MTKAPIGVIAIGLLLTLAAFVTGHFLYEAGSQRIGYTMGVMAFAPLALSAFVVLRGTGKLWAKILLGIVVLLWAAMLLVSVM